MSKGYRECSLGVNYWVLPAARPASSRARLEAAHGRWLVSCLPCGARSLTGTAGALEGTRGVLEGTAGVLTGVLEGTAGVLTRVLEGTAGVLTRVLEGTAGALEGTRGVLEGWVTGSSPCRGAAADLP